MYSIHRSQDREGPGRRSERVSQPVTSPGPAELVQRRHLEKTVSWTVCERLRCLWYRLRLTVAEMNYATRRIVELQAPWITDEVTVLPEPCPCGSAHRRIADVQGRLDDVFVYQGRRVHPHLFRSELGREAGVLEYQVRQTPGGAAIAVRCTAPVGLDGLRDRIAAALARSGLERPQVTVEAVDRLERPHGPAKLKRFIPLAANSEQSRQAPAAPSPSSSAPGDEAGAGGRPSEPAHVGGIQ